MAGCATEANDNAARLGGPDDVGGSVGASASGASSGGSSSVGGSSGSSATSGGGGASGGSAAGGAGAGSVMGGSASGGTLAIAGGGGSAGSAGSPGNDTCPDDPAKTAPGKCGCGVPDADTATAASCVPLQNALVHRYSFEGDAKDSVGTAHGMLVGGATISGGALDLAGGSSGQYLDLPNALISTLTDATIEAYVTWMGSAGGDWQRIFDFGSSDMTEGTPGIGSKYLFLSARKFRACYTSATPKSEIFVDASVTLPDATPVQVAVVVNSTAHSLSLFLDGNGVGATSLTLPLSALNDVNNWLGRSQYAPDAYFAGKISEFRIYEAALSALQLQTSKKMGENTTYLKK